MADIAKLGFESNSEVLRQTADDLNKIPPAARGAENATEKFNNEVRTGGGGITAFRQHLRGLSGELGGQLKSALIGAAAGFAAVFGATALISRIAQTADNLDQVSKAARAVGSNVSAMQALSTAGQLAGVGVDALAAATRRNNRVLGDAIASGKGTAGVFKILGISAQELAAMPIDVRFATIADRMKQLGLNTADVTNVLAKLGDRGGNLIGLLGEGGEEIRKAAGDVDKFHLAITNLQGVQIEEMNDNFTRLGYSIQGAFVQFIATIAPTMASIFINMANGIAFVVENIGQLATIAGYAAPYLIAIFGPTALAMIWAFAGAVIDGAVAAVVALTLAIRANPIGFLITALGLAIATIWTFRDDIKNAIGVDVQGIFESVGNFIIRSFLTAYETIKDMWNNFPKVIASAAFGAANFMIDAINGMIKAAVDGINGLIDLVQKIPGVSNVISKVDPNSGSIGRMVDPFAGDNQKSANIFQTKLKEIWETDYVGKIGKSLADMSAPAATAETSLNGVASAAEGVTASTAKADAAAKKLAKEAFQSLMEKGKAAQKAIDDLRKTVMDTAGAAFKTFFQDIMEGKSAIDSLTDALGNLADKLMNMVLDNVLNGLISSFIGGANIGTAWTGGWGSQGLQLARGGVMPANDNGISKYSGSVVSSPTIFKFASGTGLMGEAGPEAVMPLKRGANGSLGVDASGGGGATVVMIQPIIQNNASDKVEASASLGPNGDLIVTIDAIVAGNVNRAGSKTNKAIQGTFGVNQAVKVR